MLFKTASSTLAFMVGFTSGTKINDAKEPSTQLKQKDERKLKREQRHSTDLLKKRLKNGLVDDAKDWGGVKLEPDVGILHGKDRQLQQECVTPTCVGDDACAGAEATGKIGCGSCVGKEACLNAEGKIDNNSCTGGSDGFRACYKLEGKVGENSCSGVYACWKAEGKIDNNSCVGYAACESTGGKIGSNSCNGFLSCCGNPNDIGDDSCNADYECCDPNNEACAYYGCI